MKRDFTLHNIKPFSINATYYGNGFVKTSAAREWAFDVFHRLATPENEQAFKELRESFDPKKHGILVSLTAFYPESIFFTKQGTVSAKTFDTTNWEKGLLDLLFLPKHALSPAPQGCQNLQLDDRYVTQLTSRKSPTKELEPRIEVSIEIQAL